jgi:salicylate hydroxylase
VAEALKTYETVRRPAANAVVQRARRAGRMYQFNLDGWYNGDKCPTEREQLQIMSEEIYRQFQWIWEDGPDEAWETARKTREL